MKKLIILMAVTLIGFVSNASYLYWEITTDDTSKCTGDWESANFYLWDAENDTRGAKLGLFGGDLQEVQSLTNLGGSGEGGPIGVDLGTTLEGYTYYVELVNSSSEVVGYQKVTYASLAENYVLSTKMSPSSVATTQIWHGSYNAPEPTSALLMLLGVAGLSLKRKQRKV